VPAARAKAAGETFDEPDVPPPAAPAPRSATPASRSIAPVPVPVQHLRLPSAPNDAAREERVRMTRLRQTIAQRLKDAQNTAAMLTTFIDVDMSAVIKLRNEFQEMFEKRHGVKLGFMGLFVKACLQALKDVPAVNAEIDGDEIVYKNYYHIGVAVGTERGLVVPVVREADRMTLAEIETQITDFGKRARDGKLSIEDMQGGTFTISNGGVYGSLLSTPILNAPQSGILGMHRIEERPVVRDGQVVARPMMYLALSYDHRIVDGKDAVAFLVRVKECLEDPQRFILEL
jgi:2-oxoglutarate dehydrogenase E2 component (dihydrolipoamide succinyltransferase)